MTSAMLYEFSLPTNADKVLRTMRYSYSASVGAGARANERARASAQRRVYADDIAPIIQAMLALTRLVGSQRG
jgi:hypothetical protein